MTLPRRGHRAARGESSIVFGTHNVQDAAGRFFAPVPFAARIAPFSRKAVRSAATSTSAGGRPDANPSS